VDIDSDCFELSELDDPDEKKKKIEHAQKQKQHDQANNSKNHGKRKASVVLVKKDSRISVTTPLSARQKNSMTSKFMAPTVTKENDADVVSEFIANQQLKEIQDRSNDVDAIEEASKLNQRETATDAKDHRLKQPSVILQTGNSGKGQDSQYKLLLSTTNMNDSDKAITQKP
jgi:hypothetical protein